MCMTVFRLVRLFYEATTAHGVEVHQRGHGHRGGMDIGEAEDGNGDHIILCIECAKLIIQAGIKRVVYCKKYRLTDGIDLLTRAGIEVVYIEMTESENNR